MDPEFGGVGDRIAELDRCESSDAVDALVGFVDQGGKLLVCYQLPHQIGEALGFTQPTYVRRERSGQFAEVRFDTDDITGLPSSIRQASWNITTAQAAEHGARVIGRWYDGQGRPTSKPAMLLSDRGAFFSHVILTDDRAGKQQMLAAILGHLHPPLWRLMAEGATGRGSE